MAPNGHPGDQDDLQDGPRYSKIGPDGFQHAPKGPNTTRILAQEASETPKEPPKRPTSMVLAFSPTRVR
eukprot:4460372-Pyramimonas_sp.AAC.1